MNNHLNLPLYNLIIIRYTGEVWLKSTKVKQRMLKILIANIKSLFKRKEIKFHKYYLSKDSTRLYFFLKNENIDQSLEIFDKIFGIYSFSPALRTSNQMEHIIAKILLVAENVLEPHDSFALRVKRSGVHDYSSRDIAIKGGDAVLDNFEHLNLSVNLNEPDKVIYIEVRNEFSYIFTDKIKATWVGLPIEKRKRILSSDIGRLDDLLSAFLLMKRGCEIFPVLFDMTKDNINFQPWMGNWDKILDYYPAEKFTVRYIPLYETIASLKNMNIDEKFTCSMCKLLRLQLLSKINELPNLKTLDLRAISDGVNLNNLNLCPDEEEMQTLAMSNLFTKLLIFTPLIGYDCEEIRTLLNNISPNFTNLHYCDLEPKNQDFNLDQIKKIYSSHDFDDLVSNTLSKMKEINLFDL